MKRVWTVDEGRLGGRCGPQKAAWDLAEIRRGGFTAIVSLECNDPGIESVSSRGLRHLKLCVEDFAAPTQDQIDTFNAFVDRELADGGKVLVHCYAGRGRTGTMIASHLMRKGLSVEDAVREVRARVLAMDGTLAGAIEAVQVEALHRYGRRLEVR